LKDDFVILVSNSLNFFEDCSSCFYFCLIKIVERKNYIYFFVKKLNKKKKGIMLANDFVSIEL